MSREKEPRTKTMECPNGHHLPAQLWYWVQYVEEGGERGPEALANFAGKRCPKCGLLAVIVKD